MNYYEFMNQADEWFDSHSGETMIFPVLMVCTFLLVFWIIDGKGELDE